MSHVLVSVNAEWEVFSSARDWAPRSGKMATALINSRATLIGAQECGRSEAADLARKLGGHWQYQRAQGDGRAEGLNSVFWDSRTWEQDGDTIDHNLPSYGQMIRTIVAVPLHNRKTGEKLTLACTHFANRAAKDLTVDPVLAQRGQAAAAHKAMGDRRRVVMCVDSNSPSNTYGGRAWLNGHGWRISGNGVDILACRPGVVVESKRLISVPSDHPRAICATITTNTGKDI